MSDEPEDPTIERDGVKYLFYNSSLGIIRDKSDLDNRLLALEIYRNGWIRGGPYALDAITGRGEDPHSCGEWSELWTLDQAQEYAEVHGIDLFGPSEEPKPPAFTFNSIRDVLRIFRLW